MNAKPFDQLLRHASGLRARPRLPSPIRDSAASKTATLIAFLKEAGPASTATLCHIVDLDSRLVWGLLKAPRDRGQLAFDGKMWSAVEQYDQAAEERIRAAAALLRRNGWTVRAPSRA